MDKDFTSPDVVNPAITTQPGTPPPQYGYPMGGYPNSAYSNTGYAQQTTVVIQQPTVQVVGPRMWTTDLCGCFEDMGTCCFGTFCSMCQAMGVASDIGESSCVPCCVPGALTVMRTKIRVQNNIQGSIMDDCCTTTFCGYCALCQMAREVNFIRNNVARR